MIACFCGRIVALGASFFPHFQRSYPAILESVVGVTGLALALYLFLAIPETFREPLPQTLADLRAMKKRTRLCGSRGGGGGGGGGGGVRKAGTGGGRGGEEGGRRRKGGAGNGGGTGGRELQS